MCLAPDFVHAPGTILRKGDAVNYTHVRGVMGAVLVLTLTTVLAPTVQAAGVPNPYPPSDTADAPLAVGAYVIDAGTVTGAATLQTIGQGLKPYGLIYALVKARIPVQWVIKPSKPAIDASGVSTGGLGQTLGNVGVDFTFDCDAAGTKYTARNITTGAYIIPKEFVAQAKPVIDAFRTANLGQPAAGTVGGVAQVAPQILGYDPTAGQSQGCTSGTVASLPIFATLTGWPRTVLDSDNGSIAAGFFVNAGIPQGPLTVPSNPPAYRFAAPSQLTPCDDFYVMPHADPTYAVHKNLIAFNEQGGYIWAGCHAVSVLEGVRLNDNATSPLVMNFLTTDGLLSFKSHSAGSPPYAIYKQSTDTKSYYDSPFYNTPTYALDPVSSGDPLAQFRGRTDLAQQNGSEQIYMPGNGGTPTAATFNRQTASKWRPTTQVVMYDPTQADVYPLTTTAAPVKSTGPAASVVYGRGFGDPTNGLVLYEGGHSLNKGTVDDVAAQRIFFNAQLLNALDRSPKVTISSPTSGSTLAGNTAYPVSGTATGGSGSYTYSWSSACFDATTGAAVAGGTFSSPTSAATTFTTPNITNAINCNLSLSVVDSCGRFGFGTTSVVVVPPADVRVTKTGPATVSLDGNITYTVTVTNAGPGPAFGATLSDPLPSGTTYVAHGATPTYATPATTPAGAGGCTYASATLTCLLGNLAAGQSATTTFTVKAGVGGITVSNTASATSSSPDPNTANNSASANTQVLFSGIHVEKTGNPTLLPGAGGTVTYTFTITNTGDNPLSSVTVTDNPTCAISPASPNPAIGDIDDDDQLDITETWAFTCTRSVTAATVDTSSAEFPSDGVASTKQDIVTVAALDAGGNALSDTDNAVVTLSSPAIDVVKTLAPAGQQPGPGGIATFTITVTNTGNVPLTNIATTDPWAGECDVASIPSLATGASSTYSCAASIPAVSATATDSLPVTGATAYQQGTGWAGNWVEGGETTDPTANSVRVLAPVIAGTTTNVIRMVDTRTLTRSVNLSGQSGATLYLTYARSATFNRDSSTLTVQTSSDGTTFTNVGTIAGTGVDAVDTGYTSTFFTIPQSLMATASAIRFSSTSNDEIYLDDIALRVWPVNTVSVTGKDLLGATVSDSDTEPVTLGSPPLSIAKTASPAFVRNGNTLTYTIAVTNNSTTPQTSVQVGDVFPTALTRTGTTVTFPAVSSTDGFDCDTAETDFLPYRCNANQWTSFWTENGETTDANSGDIRVVDNPDRAAPSVPDALLLTGTGVSIQRSTYLGGAASATLSFSFLRSADYDNEPVGEDVLVQGWDGSAWVTLFTVSPRAPGGTGVLDAAFTAVAPITIPAALLRGDFALRISSNTDKDVWFDSINITTVPKVNAACTPACSDANLTPAAPVSGTSMTPLTVFAGQTVTYTITSTVSAAPADGFQFSNTAQVTSTQMTSPVAAAVSTPYYAPNYTLTKTAAPIVLVDGQDAFNDTAYTITLVNTGNVSLTPSSVSDPSCALVGPTGDTNANVLLDLGETWVYTCNRANLTSNTGSPTSPDTVTNTVTAALTDPGGGAGGTVTKTATADVTVIHPTIAVAPNPLLATIYTGHTVAYTYTVTNTGDWPVVNVGVSAANCSPALYASGDTDGDGALDITEIWTFTCTTAAISVDQAGQAVQATGAASSVFSPVASAIVPVQVNVINPALTITKTVSDSVGPVGPADAITVGVSNNVTYSFAVTNSGDSPLVAVAVDDDTCAPATYSSGDTGGDSLMSVGETWIFTCAGGQLAATTTNTATASAFDQLGGPVQSAPDTATVTVLAPKLLLGKHAGTNYVEVGGSVTFSYTVANIGGTNIVSFTPADDKCSPLTRGVDAPGDGDGVLELAEIWTYTCTVSPFNADAINFFTVIGVVDDRPGIDTYVPDPAVAQVFAINPQLDVVKTATSYVGNTLVVRDGPGDEVGAAPGDDVIYTYAVTGSTGPGGSTIDSLNAVLEVALSDDTCSPVTPTLNDNGTPLDPSDDTFNAGDVDQNGQLDVGETWYYSCAYNATSGGDVTNTVTVTANSVLDEDPLNPIPVASPSATATALLHVYDPSFTIEKQVSADGGATWLDADAATGPFIASGGTAQFRFVIDNTGNTALRVTGVVDSKGLTVSCPGGPLPVTVAVGGTLTCTASGPIPSGQYTNTATVTAQPLDIAGLAFGSPLIEADDANVFGSSPALVVTKSVTPAVYSVGDTLVFVVAVENTGNTTLTDVAITDALMSGETCNVGLSPSGSSNVTLLPGVMLECIYTYTVAAGDLVAPSDSVTNSATVSAVDPVGEPVSGGDTTTALALVARDDAYVRAHDVGVSASVALNDTVPSGSTFGAVYVMPASVGTYTLSAAGALLFDPAADFSGVVSFPYQVCAPAPNGSVCETATVTIYVGPVAVDDSGVTTVDTVLNGASVLANDLGTAANLVVTVRTDAATAEGGTVTVAADGTYTYTPPAGFSGVDTFTYEVCDSTLTAVAPAADAVDCDTATVTIYVGPVAVDDTGVTTVDTVLLGSSVLGNDEGTAANLVVTAQTGTATASSGSVDVAADGTYVYTPPARVLGCRQLQL